MSSQGNRVAASSPKRSDAGLHNQAVWRLPAWAFEKLLARAWRSHAEEGSAILRLAFPPGTPVACASADFPQYKHLAVQDSLMQVFDGWDCQVLGEDDTDGLPPPYYRHFEVSPTDKRLAYESACLRLSHPGGQQAAALITLAVPDGECHTKSILTLCCPSPARELIFGMMADIERLVAQDTSLRGRKLDASGGFIKQERTYDWECVFADPTLIAIVRRNTQGFLERLEAYRRLGLPTHRGVLLHGRPGTGKTLIGKVLCSQLRQTFIWVRPADGIGSPFNPNGIGRVFDMARDLAPALLFFEDLDLAAPRRSRHAAFENATLGELMNQLDGLKENDGIVVVATTNDLDAIEPALKDRPSRFDCVMELPEITDDIRQRYLQAFLAARGVNGAFYGEIEQATAECRTIAEVQEQAIRCLQRAIENGLDPAAVAAPGDLPLLDQPQPVEETPIGFKASRN